ncbi:MAG TPA: 2OG-Fe(II) oxygenase [Puia sp.]|nr:2OG-Fe(II) oxygenase [Puia sp.]
MPDFGKQLLAILGEIKGSGSFVSSGIEPFLFPGLQIRNVDEIGFPVNATQIKEMIKVAHQAPFGKGSKTVLDKTVRNTWEIDADQIKFVHKGWGKFVESIVEKISPALGLEGLSVSANLYKLLIYQKGGFFLAHKDSEKERGMFGTLIIGLPSRHTGGELAVRFDGRQEIIDFSGPASQYEIPFAAFYADCEHEIMPIISGYRVCLVYNLVQNDGKRKVQPQPMGDSVKRLAAVLKASEKDRDIPKIVLLGHQYTPSNFTMKALKLNDRLKAESLIQAAGHAGFYVKLGLVTSYQTGELEMKDSKRPTSLYSRRKSYYDDYYDDEDLTENGTMGEVYYGHVGVEHWMEEGVPPLRNIEFDEMDLVAPAALNEGEPIEKNAEGYTGNAGMEMQYWYHYGAVFLWPQKCHYDMLIGLDTDNQLEWIDYYNQRWSVLGQADINITKKLVGAGLQESDLTEDIDFSPLVDWLINLQDEKYLSGKGAIALTNHFTHIPVDKWINLFEKYSTDHFEDVFSAAADRGKTAIINHLIAILTKLRAWKFPTYKTFLANQTEKLPAYLKALKLTASSEKEAVRNILRNLLQMDIGETNNNAAWLKETTDAFTKPLTKDYVNEVLVAEILESEKKSDLAKQILAICKGNLKRRVQDRPKPPTDWARSLPKSAGGYKEVWDILADFLKSPTLQVFEYQALQTNRKEMEHAIRNVTIDIKMETIRKGSPHSLRLTKTQDAYLKELAKWKKDVELLKKAEAW